MEPVEYSYPLERSPAMRILGVMWTGKISGQIFIFILIMIGVGFMGALRFAPITIIFFIIFIIPNSILIHLRLVRKGKKLMEGWCDVKFYSESNILEYKSGFPNTMDPDWQEVEITEENRDITIKGSERGGYHMRLGEKPDEENEYIRLGLWINLDDAIHAAEQLQEHLGGHLEVKIQEKNEENPVEQD